MRPISQSFRCLDAVARRGSVRKAAETLHLTAAAVHQQILNFEEQVGTPLFDRLPRGMKLTAAGEIVLASVRRAQRDYEQALAQVEALRTLQRGHVSLGVPHASAEGLMPRVMRGDAARIPGHQLRRAHRQRRGAAACGGRRRSRPGLLPAAHGAARASNRCAPGRSNSARWSRPAMRWRSAAAGCACATAWPPAGAARARHGTARRWSSASPAASASWSSRRCRPHRWRWCARWPPTPAWSGCWCRRTCIQDVAAGRLCWLPLADAEAQSATALYQRIGQRAAVATGVFVQFLDSAFNELVRSG